MKTQTYLRFLLLLPYLLWVILLVWVQAYGGNVDPTLPDGTFARLLALLPYIYVIGILFWFVPYTLLALGLLMWSIKRKAKTILVVFAFSPLLLAALILLELNLLAIATQAVTYSLADSHVRDLMALNQVVIFASLISGYFCVAVGFGSYKLFQFFNVFKEAVANVEPAMEKV